MSMQGIPLFVGTYSHPILTGDGSTFCGNGKGIYAMFLTEGNAPTIREGTLYAGIENASFLMRSADGRFLHCVNELDAFQGAPGGAVSTYRVTPDGVTLVSQLPSQGAAPCHIAVNRDETLLAVSNYTSGSLSLYPLDKEGVLNAPQTIVHHGQGKDPARQASSHVHSAWFAPDNSFLLAVDLGLDTLTLYPIAKQAQRISDTEAKTVRLQPGDGPRICRFHAALHRLYVLCELSNTVAVFACDQAGAPVGEAVQRISTLPEDVEGFNSAAELRLSPDGRFLYASNRGHNSLSVYAVSPQDGRLMLLQSIPCGGKTPRFFTLSPSGRTLLCANQDSDTITLFAVELETGTLTFSGEATVPTPVCVAF